MNDLHRRNMSWSLTDGVPLLLLLDDFTALPAGLTSDAVICSGVDTHPKQLTVTGQPLAANIPIKAMIAMIIFDQSMCAGAAIITSYGVLLTLEAEELPAC